MALNDNALTARATASTFLGITDGADAVVDAETERLVNTASEMIAKRTNRVLYKKTHTEYWDGSRTNRILLSEWPITGGPAAGATKPEISIDSKSLFASGTEIDTDEYYVDRDIAIVMINLSFPKGTRNVKVIWEAGLGNHASDDFPSDLQNACLELVQFLLNKKHDRRIGIQTKGKLNENISYELGIPKYIDELLLPYIRLDFNTTNAPVSNG